MLKRVKISALLYFLTVTFFACDEVREHDELANDTVSFRKQERTETKKETSREEAEKIKFSKAEKVFLKTFDTISFGNDFSQIKKTFPTVREMGPEGDSDELASEGLTESNAVLSLLNRDAKVEFNYKNDSLYSYYLSLEEQDYNTAEKLFNEVHERYSKEYGDCEKEPVEEENRYNKTCYWNIDGRTAVMTYNINEGIISWGFQAQEIQ